MQQLMYFDLMAFISAFIFTPAIIVLSAIEVYRGHNVYYWTSAGLVEDDLVKAIIPIVIAGVGLIEMIMCVIAVFYLCCCNPAATAASNMYGSGRMDKTVVMGSAQHYNPQATYDRAYNTQPTNQMSCAPCGGQSSSFYAAQTPPRFSSTYNQFNTGPMQCNGFKQCSAPNPAYNYFRS